MIKAVIFDLNGIFLQGPKLSEKIEKDFDIPISEFLPILSQIMEKVRQPNAGKAFQYWQPFLEKWKITMSEADFWNYWFKSEIPSETMINYAKKLREDGFKVFILSNNFKERAEYYSHYSWINEAVDRIYYSWQSGFVKPNPQAWLQVLADNNLEPDECIFFDDQDKNLKAAESVGIKSFLFTNEKDLQRIINSVIKQNH